MRGGGRLGVGEFFFRFSGRFVGCMESGRFFVRPVLHNGRFFVRPGWSPVVVPTMPLPVCGTLPPE